MADQIQDDLLAWIERGDRARGGRALDALADEWRPRVLRFLQGPGADEVEEVLEEALCALCVAELGRRPRALAPDDVESAAAWRRKVLKNYLIDRSRRSGRRRHAEQAQAQGLSTAAEAEAWRTTRAPRSAGEGAPISLPPPAQEPAPVSADPVELGAMRHDVLRALPELAIRRRVLLLLALGGDPSPFAEALARELGDDEAEVLARIRAARRAGHDGGHDHLSLTMIRVVWPDDPEPKARETARKNLERAVQDIRLRLGV